MVLKTYYEFEDQNESFIKIVKDIEITQVMVITEPA